MTLESVVSDYKTTLIATLELKIKIIMCVILKMGHSRPLFVFIFVISTVNRKHVRHKISPMTGFKPRTSGIGSFRFPN